MKLTPAMLEKIPHVDFKHAGKLTGKTITGVCTDSRKIQRGELFVALHGEQFDGHAFIRQALDQGAIAVIAEAGRCPDALPRVPLLLVEDSIRAYGDLARLYRRRHSIPLIAIAGSNGKTTTKEMVARVLREKHNVLSTEGNLNNHIGVPATLLRIDRHHDVAVVELGTNHPGELEYLCRMAAPTHGLVTMIGSEHLEFFKNIDGVAEEEGALYRYLARTPGSVAFVSAGDERVTLQAKPVRKKIRYGYSKRGMDVRGAVEGIDARGCVRIRFSGPKMRRGISVQLNLPGRHNAVNALAAAAVGLVFGISPEGIRGALQEFQAPARRMEVRTVKGVIVINDTYNANADSTIASLRALAETNVTGKRIAVLGDMLELGRSELEEHTRVGAAVSELGIEYLLTFGRRAVWIHDAARLPFAVQYDQKNILAEYLAELVTPGDAVLVKGSRGMKMEDVVTFLLERLESPTTPAP